jgi:spermidine synthase
LLRIPDSMLDVRSSLLNVRSSMKSTSPTPDSTYTAPPHARLILSLICFLAGAAIMIVEISANRLLAPLFGNTSYTWTALIGVILIAFSVGGYLGGWLAEKKADFALLGWLLASAAVLTMFIPAVFVYAGPANAALGHISGPVTISIILFALPGVLLGAISPASVRLYSLLSKDAHVGTAAGTISMLGSLGSFVGTFLSGFYLLSNYGVQQIFVGTGVALLVLAGGAFFLGRQTLQQMLPVLLSGVIASWYGSSVKQQPKDGVVHQQDSFYHHIEVIEQGTEAHRQRFLQLDSTMEGGMRVVDGALVLDYQNYWQLPLIREGFSFDSALFIGAGAFGMPERMARDFPKAQVDVAEIDPAVIEVGRRYFKLDEHPRVHAFADDARHYLYTQKDKRYDFIFGDAYNGVRAIPVHLASKEFFQLIHDRLTPRGVFLMNAITAVNGKRAELLSGMITTLQQVFPHVEIFSVGGRRDEAQNVMLLASNDDWKPLFADRAYVPGSWQDVMCRQYVPAEQWPGKGVVFTDDLNPVDAIIRRGL